MVPAGASGVLFQRSARGQCGKWQMQRPGDALLEPLQGVLPLGPRPTAQPHAPRETTLARETIPHGLEVDQLGVLQDA